MHVYMYVYMYVSVSNIYIGEVVNIWGVSSLVLYEYSFSEHLCPSLCGCVFLSPWGASVGMESLCCVVSVCVTL